MRPTGVPIESRMLPCMPERKAESRWEGQRQHRAYCMQRQKQWEGERPTPHMHRNLLAWKAVALQQQASQMPALPGSRACAVTLQRTFTELPKAQ